MMHTLSLLAVVLDLAGTWTLQSSDELKFCPITVPGDVQSALLAAGRIPDPFYAQNERKVQWVSDKTWIVSRRFTVPAEVLAARDVVLRLDDVDLFCDVYLNGVRIGSTDDRYLRYDFDVKAALRAGENEIRGVFRCTLDELEKLVRDGGPFYPTGGGTVPYMTLLRKPPCHGGWDWGLCQMTVGFLGRVEILASDASRVDYVYCDQEFADDFRRCRLTAHAELSDGTVETKTVEIDDPPLWWPNGLGEQKFYEFEIHGVKRRIGLRKLEVVRTPDKAPDGSDGLGMKFRVNGVDVFAKGANWIPCDAFAGRMTRDRYRDLLGSAARANMNMIRLWGGGQYERDDFYEACDELGLLIWHDHPFACGIYPADGPFLDKVRAEMRHQLKRLRDHASIAMWCGDNECVGSLNWYPESMVEPTTARADFFRRVKVQEEMTALFDPVRILWPSSPCAGPGSLEVNWKNSAKGDIHNWSVGGGRTPFSKFYEAKPRFLSEFGLQSFPSPETCELFVPPEKIDLNDPDFAWHQKSPGGNKGIVDRFETLFAKPATAREAIFLSQVQQALGIKTAVEYCRTLRPWCMGTIYWQLDDLWPVASWSSLEYGGKWKQLHYAARRFYAPRLAVACPVGGDPQAKEVEVTALNDTREAVCGSVRVRVLNARGDVLMCAEFPCEVPAGGVVRAGRVPIMPKAFLVMDFDGSRNDYFFSPFKEMDIRAAHVTATPFEKGGAWCVRLETDAPAFAVMPDARKIRGEFSDASLTLLPGEPQTVVFRPREGETADFAAFRKALSVAHLTFFPRQPTASDRPFRGLKATPARSLTVGSGLCRFDGVPYALAADGEKLTVVFERKIPNPAAVNGRAEKVSLLATAGELYCTFYADYDGRVRGKWSCTSRKEPQPDGSLVWTATAHIRWPDIGLKAPPGKEGVLMLDRKYNIIKERN